MPARIRTDMADVVRGISVLRERGVPVEWRNGRVVGLRQLRALVGGDGERVRAMAVVELHRLRCGVDKDALLDARELLRGPRSASPFAGLSAKERERMLDLTAEFIRSVLSRGEGHWPFAEDAAATAEEAREEEMRTDCQPNDGRTEVTMVRAEQNAPSKQAAGPGALARLIEEHRSRELVQLPEYNPYALDDDE